MLARLFTFSITTWTRVRCFFPFIYFFPSEVKRRSSVTSKGTFASFLADRWHAFRHQTNWFRTWENACRYRGRLRQLLNIWNCGATVAPSSHCHVANGCSRVQPAHLGVASHPHPGKLQSLSGLGFPLAVNAFQRCVAMTTTKCCVFPFSHLLSSKILCFWVGFWGGFDCFLLVNLFWNEWEINFNF